MRFMRKNPKILIVAVFAVVALIATAFLVMQRMGENQGYRTISVVDVSGRVSVVQDGKEYKAYPGMLLREGHEIVTSGNSYVRLVLDDDKYIKLEPGSKLVFETLGVLGSGKTKLCLERGAITTELVAPLNEGEDFVINTPNAVLAVRGTFFRIDLDMLEDGVVIANVMTYGGQVASQRILPSGEVVEEDVLIDAGYMACINMDIKDTVYVVDGMAVEETTTEETTAKTMQIEQSEISDEDLIDIYFAAENGHELFLTVEEAKESIEERHINIEEKTSVYDIAEEVKREQEAVVSVEKQNTTSTAVVANDSQPLARVEEEVDAEEDEEGSIIEKTQVDAMLELVTDGDGTTVVPHVHTVVPAGEEYAHTKCSECDEIVSVQHSFVEETLEPACLKDGAKKYICECGYSYEEVIEALGHSQVKGGLFGAHSICEVCGEILEDRNGHVYIQETTEATCTEHGKTVHSCECGYSYETVLYALGHTERKGGLEDRHKVCGVCGSLLEDGTAHFFVSEMVTEATCVNTGLEAYICSCGYRYEVELPAKGHVEANGAVADSHKKCSVCGENLVGGTGHNFNVVNVAATCTTAGKKIYTCACGYGYETSVAVIGHTETSGGSVYVHSKCSVCGETIENGDAHSYSEDVTEQGGKVYRCDCGYSYEESHEEVGHTEVAGGEEHAHSKCSVCGETIVDGTGHSYTESITEATCTNAGSKVYTCACGYSYEEEIVALGHSYGEWLTDTKATCTVAGSRIHICGICGETEREEIAALGHDFAGEFTIDTEATCTIPGSKSKHCRRCDEKSQVTEIAAWGHSYGEWSIVTAATCITDGIKTHTCSLCSYAENEVLTTLGHSFADEFTVDVQTTCTVAGSKSKHCMRCDEKSEITEIPAIGHIEVVGGEEDCHSKCSICGETLSTAHSYTEKITTAETCTTAGVKTYTCSCGYSYTGAIPATGHTEVAGATESSHRKCSVCGEILADGSAHSYTCEVTTEATCTTAGIRTYTCECGYSYTESISATGHSEIPGAVADCHTKCNVCDAVLSVAHSYTEEVTTEAACTTAGVRTYTCTCGYSYTEIIEATGHTKGDGATADCHSICMVCGETLEDGTAHSYTDRVTMEATCAETGERTYICECGYSYTETIEAIGHTEGDGATADCHSICMVCGETLEDGTAHKFTDEVTIEATCTEAGERIYTCDCGYSYVEEIPAMGHTEAIGGTVYVHSKCSVCDETIEDGNAHTYTEVTTASGSKVYSCECGYSYEEAHDEIGHTVVPGGTENSHSKCSICGETIEDGSAHSYVESITEATCTEAGKHVYSCECGYSYEEEIEALGHSYSAWTVVTEATCTTTGIQEHICSVCSEVESEEITALGHDYASEFTIDVEATCTTAGSKSKHCSRCDATSEVTEIPATGHSEADGAEADCHSKCSVCGETLSTEHNYTDTTTEATCTDSGKTVHSCECGYSYETEIPATGHSYGAWTEVTAATCTTEGEQKRTCSTCSEVETGVLEALDHDFATEFTVDTAATCTTEGSKSKHCSRCDATSEVTEIPATGHSETDGAEADCHSKCSVCGETLSTEHNYTDTTTEATCTDSGKTVHSCGCGYSYETEIPATGHSYGAWTEVTAATCTTEGEQKRTCSTCSEVETGVLEALDHDFATEFTVDTAATCTAVGSKSKHCSRCDATSEVTEIPATGHSEADGAEADCHSKCSVCGTTLADGTAHSYTNKVTTEATCTTAGVRTYTCECGYSYTEEIAASHIKADETASVTTCSRCGEKLVDLNATNFPDATFLTYVEQFDTDGDNMLLGSELTKVTEINVSGTSSVDGGITSLTGIEHFTELTSIRCDYNSGITSIDISAFENLTSLYAVNCTGITNLNVANHTTLEYLNICGCTALGNVDYTGCTGLQTLYVNRGTITELDVSACTALTQLHVESCEQLVSLDLRANTNLENVNARYMTSLHSFNASGCTKVTRILLSGDTALQSIDVSGCTSLTTLDTSTLTGLTTLTITGSGLESVDLAANTSLTTLTAQNCESLTNVNAEVAAQDTNALTTVDVSGCTNLVTLDLRNCNKVTSLDTSTLSGLKELDIAYTGLTTFNGSTSEIDLSDNAELTDFQANQIGSFSTVNIAGNTKLETFVLSQNTKLSGIDFTNNASIKTIQLDSVTALTALDVSDLAALASLDVSNCNSLETLDVSNCTALTSLDTSTLTALKTLTITGSGLESVNLASNLALETFVAENSSLTSLEWTNQGTEASALTTVDVSGSEALTKFMLLGNFASVATIDTSGCMAMTGFEFNTQDDSYTSALTSLNYEGCTAMESITLHVTYGDLPITGVLDFANYPNLKSISLSSVTNITAINLASNTNLTAVSISDSIITELDVSNSTGLEELVLSDCDNLTSIDLSQNKALVAVLIAFCDRITSFELEDCPSLVYVEAMDIPTISLKNVPELIEVRIGFDFVPVTSLTINGSEKMTSLDLKNLRDLETLDLTNCTALTSFDITGCTSLQSLDLNGCTGITSLDMSGYSGLTSLTYLDIQNNGNLKSVDFSTLTALETIDLAMSGNMTDINISNTQLTSFDSAGMYYVETYICQNATKLAQVYLGNAFTLTALDVTGCSSTLQIDLSDSSPLYGSNYATTITGYENTMNVY